MVENDITALLIAWNDGRPGVLEKLAAEVDRELRKLARAYMRRERSNHTLQPTALVNEAYLRLIDQDRVVWRNRMHFYGIAAQCMRRILVDHGRRQRAAKRAAGRRVTFDEALAKSARDPATLAVLAEAVERLASTDERAAAIVELRVFAGLSIQDVATSLGVSPGTVKRDWLAAKLWLQRELG